MSGGQARIQNAESQDSDVGGGRRPLFRPYIMGVQKIAVYETKARFFLVGSNSSQTKFRVLKVDRTEPKQLSIIDDKVEYSVDEIRELLAMIHAGNKFSPSSTRSSGSTGPRLSTSKLGGKSAAAAASVGLQRTVSAFGILGFVRFLQGYYMVLVTKRRRVALIGRHTVFKVEDTALVYVPNEECCGTGVRGGSHPDESRLVKIFQNVDLSANFYFSYSYDLSQTLQYNMATPTTISAAAARTDQQPCECDTSGKEDGERCTACDARDVSGQVFGYRVRPEYRYIWNEHLLSALRQVAHPDWLLNLIHGYVGQSELNVFGRALYLTLLARRSCRFAGTRFLKRGANDEGDVANDVETEQILFNASLSFPQPSGQFSSYVQVRGSVPAFWSQDLSKMVPKPPITLDVADPYALSAGKHFNQMLGRHGAPLIVINLVKKREKQQHQQQRGREQRSAGDRAIIRHACGQHATQRRVQDDRVRADRHGKHEGDVRRGAEGATAARPERVQEVRCDRTKLFEFKEVRNIQQSVQKRHSTHSQVGVHVGQQPRSGATYGQPQQQGDVQNVCGAGEAWAAGTGPSVSSSLPALCERIVARDLLSSSLLSALCACKHKIQTNTEIFNFKILISSSSKSQSMKYFLIEKK